MLKGVWRLQREERRDTTTRQRIRREKTVHGTQKDAQRALSSEHARVDSGKPPRQTRLTVGAWLDEHFDHWCQGVSARLLDPFDLTP